MSTYKVASVFGEREALETAFSELHEKLRETTEELVHARKNEKIDYLVQDREEVLSVEYDLLPVFQKQRFLADDLLDVSSSFWEISWSSQIPMITEVEQSCMLEQCPSIDFRPSTLEESPSLALVPFSKESENEKSEGIKSRNDFSNEELKHDIRNLISLLQDMRQKKESLERVVEEKHRELSKKVKENSKLELQFKLNKSNLRRLQESLTQNKLVREEMKKAHQAKLQQYEEILRKNQNEIESLSEKNFKQKAQLIHEAQKASDEILDTPIESNMSILKSVRQELRGKKNKIKKYQRAIVHLKERLDMVVTKDKRSRGCQVIGCKSARNIDEKVSKPNKEVLDSEDSFSDEYSKVLKEIKPKPESVIQLRYQLKKEKANGQQLRAANEKLKGYIKKELRQFTQEKRNETADMDRTGSNRELSTATELKAKLKKTQRALSDREKLCATIREELRLNKSKIVNLWSRNKKLQKEMQQKNDSAVKHAEIAAKNQAKSENLEKLVENYKEKVGMLRKKCTTFKGKLKELNEGLSPDLVAKYLSQVELVKALEEKVLSLQSIIQQKECLRVESDKIAQAAVSQLKSNEFNMQEIEVQEVDDWHTFCSNARKLLKMEEIKCFNLRKSLVEQESQNEIQKILIETQGKEQDLLHQELLKMKSIIKTKLKQVSHEVIPHSGSHPLTTLLGRQSRKKDPTSNARISMGIQCKERSKTASTCFNSFQPLNNKEISCNLSMVSTAVDTSSKLEGKNEYQIIERKLSQLENENKRLKKELAVFDINFFDEIEDLKYNYAKLLEEKALRT